MAVVDPYERFRELANQQLQGRRSVIRDAAIQRLLYYSEDAGVPVETLVERLAAGTSLAELTAEVLARLQDKLDTDFRTAAV
jgi:hypothetical protein